MHPLKARHEFGIFGFDREGETEVAFGVFVAAIDLRVIRQVHQLFERPVHLRGSAFEKSPAPSRKERITAEKIIIEKIGDMASGMPRYIEYSAF